MTGTDRPEAAAARAGADVETTPQDAPDQLPGSRLDQQTIEATREALPDWHVQPDQLVRTVAAPDGPAPLRAALEQVARDAGRVPEITVDGDEVTVRLRIAGGRAAALNLAAAMDRVLPGTRPPGSASAAGCGRSRPG